MAARILAGILFAVAAFAWWQYRAAHEIRDDLVRAEIAVDSQADKLALLEAQTTAQAEANRELIERVDEAQREKERYMRIFADHDLQKLLRAKPGLMERRINDGTAKVFEDVKAASGG